MDTDEDTLTGGLQSLVMRRKSLLHEHSLETNVTIGPSAKITDHTGVFMHVNCHHSLAELPADHGSEQAMTLLTERFEQATEEAETIINAMMKTGRKRQ